MESQAAQNGGAVVSGVDLQVGDAACGGALGAGGAIVNILSVNSLAPLPFIIPAYSVSKAAALAIFDAVGKGEEEIFPDPASAPMAALWRTGAAKLLECQFAQLARVSS